jgi:hypothetical protein
VAGDPIQRSPPLGAKAPAWLHHEAPDSSAGPQTGQFGRSEAEAKLHRFGLDPGTTAASCGAIRGPDHRSSGLALPCSTTIASGVSPRLRTVFVGTEGPTHTSPANRKCEYIKQVRRESAGIGSTDIGRSAYPTHCRLATRQEKHEPCRPAAIK